MHSWRIHAIDDQIDQNHCRFAAMFAQWLSHGITLPSFTAHQTAAAQLAEKQKN
jgi:hypothetical protein